MKEIIVISGRSGLFRLISGGKNYLIIESLADKNRSSVHLKDKFTPLNEMKISTNEGETPVCEVLSAIKRKEDGKQVSIDVRKADNDVLQSYMAEVLPNYNRKRVYPNDIRKLLKWYDLLLSAGIADFFDTEGKPSTPE